MQKSYVILHTILINYTYKQLNYFNYDNTNKVIIKIIIKLNKFYKFKICISLVQYQHTDQLDPYQPYGRSWSVWHLRTIPLTHTHHKCISHMPPTMNQPPQQRTPTPSPSLKLTDHKKKTHPREKTEENNEYWRNK